jgi:hypothetical protein
VRALSTIINLLGKSYQKDSVSTIVSRFVAPGCSYELDPTLISPGETIAKNIHAVREASSLVLSYFEESLPRIPK